MRQGEIAAAVEKAREQAQWVTVTGEWLSFDDGREISGDLHANVRARVRNPTGHALHDVSIWFDRAYDREDRRGIDDGQPVLMGRIGQVAPNGTDVVGGITYVHMHTFGDHLAFITEFTDDFRERWRLDADGTLTLLSSRVIDVDDDSQVSRHPDQPPIPRPAPPRDWL